MDLESPPDRQKAAADAGDSDVPPPLHEQQFTLRDLRLARPIVWILVAIGFAVARHWIVAAVLALIVIPALFMGDWLIRPANRSALAFVGAGSWIVLGCGLVIGALVLVYHPIAKQSGAAGWIIAAFLTLTSIVCFVTAGNRWRGDSSQRRANL